MARRMVRQGEEWWDKERKSSNASLQENMCKDRQTKNQCQGQDEPW